MCRPGGGASQRVPVPDTGPRYAYDGAGQLVGDGSRAYSYDAAGNRSGDGYKVGPGNQILADGVWTYSYDAEGNRVGKVDQATGVAWVYSYDNANRLVSAVETDDGRTLQSVTYAYDVFGNRIERAARIGDAPPTVQRHVYVGETVWADLDAENRVTTRYLVGDGIDQILARADSDGRAAWYLTDRLGSVRDVVDLNGAVIDRIEYDAFGNVTIESSSAWGDRYKFTGREYDAATGVYYNRARYYDPATGSWTSQDPLGFDAGDPNLYRYVGNGPTNATDPSGLFGDARGMTPKHNQRPKPNGPRPMTLEEYELNLKSLDSARGAWAGIYGGYITPSVKFMTLGILDVSLEYEPLYDAEAFYGGRSIGDKAALAMHGVTLVGGLKRLATGGSAGGRGGGSLAMTTGSTVAFAAGGAGVLQISTGAATMGAAVALSTALPKGEGGAPNSPQEETKALLRYKLGRYDLDWRGTGKKVDDALSEAFSRTGLPRSEFVVTKWGKDKYGKSVPVEWRHRSGAEVSIDLPHAKNGPDAPHVGWQTGGKRGSGGAVRGHIILDEAPYNR